MNSWMSTTWTSSANKTQTKKVNFIGFMPAQTLTSVDFCRLYIAFSKNAVWLWQICQVLLLIFEKKTHAKNLHLINWLIKLRDNFFIDLLQHANVKNMTKLHFFTENNKDYISVTLMQTLFYLKLLYYYVCIVWSQCSIGGNTV